MSKKQQTNIYNSIRTKFTWCSSETIKTISLKASHIEFTNCFCSGKHVTHSQDSKLILQFAVHANIKCFSNFEKESMKHYANNSFEFTSCKIYSTLKLFVNNKSYLTSILPVIRGGYLIIITIVIQPNIKAHRLIFSGPTDLLEKKAPMHVENTVMLLD